MKHNFILKTLKGLLILLAISNSAFGQYVYLPKVRGLYVDDFIKFYTDGDHVNPKFSILGVDEDGNGSFEKEDALLEYCRQNHITHLVLYDLHLISYRWNVRYNNDPTKNEYDVYLCNFINKAKSQYCIQTIGAAGYKRFDRIGTFNTNNFQTPVYQFPQNFSPSSIQNHFSFVEQPHPPGDPLYNRAENAKHLLRIGAFNATTGCDIDVLVTLYEFWTNTESRSHKYFINKT